jgi:hypothetical protein
VIASDCVADCRGPLQARSAKPGTRFRREVALQSPCAAAGGVGYATITRNPSGSVPSRIVIPSTVCENTAVVRAQTIGDALHFGLVVGGPHEVMDTVGSHPQRGCGIRRFGGGRSQPFGVNSSAMPASRTTTRHETTSQ